MHGAPQVYMAFDYACGIETNSIKGEFMTFSLH